MTPIRKFSALVFLSLMILLLIIGCTSTGEGLVETESSSAGIQSSVGMDDVSVDNTAGQSEAVIAREDGSLPPEGHGSHEVGPLQALPGLLTNVGIVALLIAAVQVLQWPAGRRQRLAAQQVSVTDSR